MNVFSRSTAAWLLLSLLLTGCSADPADGTVDSGIQAVRLLRVGADEAAVTSRRFVGRVEAKSRVDLAFQVEGQIRSIPVREGQVVEPGALIAALDPEGFELALAQAEARLALAKAEHDRARELFTRAAVSQSRIDEVSADLKLAEVAVGIARRNLGLTRIEAPFKALITRRLLDPFAFVTSMNPTPVVRVQDVSELRVRLAIPGPLIGLARDPDRFSAVARLASDPAASWPLEPRELVTEADPVAQTYALTLAVVGPPDPRLLPGLTVIVELRDTARTNVDPTPSIPLTAIDTSGVEDFRVWVYAPDSGTVSPRAVSLGLPEADRVPVRSGLEVGEQIVTGGVHRLFAGQRVRAFEP
ncbi:MAG: efflux RND transporter periplasmic adaptor subunit [Chromatiales bacterium]|nr:efflux RND transporter periplasmic adaptor subunit [Chromatiales bacterium]